MAPNPENGDAAIVFFDGDCSLCNAAVRFIIPRDPRAAFRFASLQSPLGQQWEKHAGVSVDAPGATMLLLRGGRLFARSDAALRVARDLGRTLFGRMAWWTFATVGLAIPRSLRDVVYGLVARNRHRLGLSSDTCWLPTEQLKERLLG